MIKLDTSIKQMMYNSIQTLTLDDLELSEYLYKQSHNDRVHNLVLAWTSCEGNDLDYIWDHINNQSEIYLPILICPDDVVSGVRFLSQKLNTLKIQSYGNGLPLLKEAMI